jgi:hypothetical protein
MNQCINWFAHGFFRDNVQPQLHQSVQTKLVNDSQRRDWLALQSAKSKFIDTNKMILETWKKRASVDHLKTFSSSSSSATHILNSCSPIHECAPTTKEHMKVIVFGAKNSGKSTCIGHLLHLNGNTFLGKKDFPGFESNPKYAHHIQAGNMCKVETDSKVIEFELSTCDASCKDSQVWAKVFVKGPIYAAVWIINMDFADIRLQFNEGDDDGVNTKTFKKDSNAADTVSGNSNAETMAALEQHLSLLRHAGVRYLVIAMNKMDNCSYSERRFENMASQLRAGVLKRTGWIGSETNVSFIPTSALNGANLLSLQLQSTQSSLYATTSKSGAGSSFKGSASKPGIFYHHDYDMNVIFQMFSEV